MLPNHAAADRCGFHNDEIGLLLPGARCRTVDEFAVKLLDPRRAPSARQSSLARRNMTTFKAGCAVYRREVHRGDHAPILGRELGNAVAVGHASKAASCSTGWPRRRSTSVSQRSNRISSSRSKL